MIILMRSSEKAVVTSLLVNGPVQYLLSSPGHQHQSFLLDGQASTATVLIPILSSSQKSFSTKKKYEERFHLQMFTQTHEHALHLHKCNEEKGTAFRMPDFY